MPHSSTNNWTLMYRQKVDTATDYRYSAEPEPYYGAGVTAFSGVSAAGTGGCAVAS